MPESIQDPSSIQSSIDEDIARRVAVHQATIARLQAADEGRAALGDRMLATAAVNQPKVMLAHGDSWFDYPLNGNGLPYGDTDVIAQLRRIGAQPPIILNLAHRGDAATTELSLPKQERLVAQLRSAANWPRGKPDAILFSAGGNDIAGENFVIVLDFNDGRAQGLNRERFDGVLASVRACYLALFDIRNRHAPGVPVFGHGYDFPIPNGSHPVCAGPWLKPSLDYSNWSVAAGTRIIREALTAFNSMLKSLAADRANNFHLVPTQGTLVPSDWANELHPKPDGFRKIAAKFAAALDIPAFDPASALMAAAAEPHWADGELADTGAAGAPIEKPKKSRRQAQQASKPTGRKNRSRTANDMAR